MILFWPTVLKENKTEQAVEWSRRLQNVRQVKRCLFGDDAPERQVEFTPGRHEAAVTAGVNALKAPCIVQDAWVYVWVQGGILGSCEHVGGEPVGREVYKHRGKGESRRLQRLFVMLSRTFMFLVSYGPGERE